MKYIKTNRQDIGVRGLLFRGIFDTYVINHAYDPGKLFIVYYYDTDHIFNSCYNMKRAIRQHWKMTYRNGSVDWNGDNDSYDVRSNNN